MIRTRRGALVASLAALTLGLSACGGADGGGGGDDAACPSSAPATTVISVRWPSASVWRTRGVSPSHSMAKCGSANLSSAGRFTQIWKNSRGFGAPSSSRGNISEWTMPLPAVTHWVSPRPNRAAAPRESA